MPHSMKQPPAIQQTFAKLATIHCALPKVTSMENKPQS
jgi:hypothetical protein